MNNGIYFKPFYMLYLFKLGCDTMKITLFLPSQILHFTLPPIIAGHFIFDEKEEEESKLINIEARENHWVLHKTDEVKIISNNIYKEEVVLEDNHFYLLEKENVKYLLYVTKLTFSGLRLFTYTDNTVFTIGNLVSSTIRYNTPYITGLTVTIEYKNHQLTLQKNGSPILYINKKVLDKNFYALSFGEELYIYGLQIIFLKGVLLLNNLENCTVAENLLHPFVYPVLEEAKTLEVKDTDLYKKEEYFSKSPRLRRIIKTKEIKLSEPPKSGDMYELPLLLVIGPMLTMGIASITMFASILMRLNSGETSLKNSWPQLITSGVMFISMLVWPLITQWYNRRQKKKLKKEIIQKYTKYLSDKRRELEREREQQKIILYENLIPLEDCLTIIQNQKIHFWDKRVDQNDFLIVRLGIGREFLDVKISYPEEGFSIEENELREKADALVNEFLYIDNVPLGYSLYENKITAIMGTHEKSVFFAQNLLLQLITFYSYEDVKLVLFTNKKRENLWHFLKYLPHNFTNQKDFRFFSSGKEETKELANYLHFLVNNRKGSNPKNTPHKPHYLILIDEWDSIYQNETIKKMTEMEENLGFSFLLIENRMGKLPSKCNNFISLDGASSKVLKNAYDEQIHLFFTEEIHYNIPMLAIAKSLSNVPIELEEGYKELPNAISFLEMERVGKVEQLNVLNRWNTLDATSSLRAEIGVDEQGDSMYLDLHEKFHGPHGLIAGMTGSGKSEFIITYILSMAINYSPDDVAFILIDYKGGGLAFAFENKRNQMILPHLAGTITNLDKVEMDRTLVSIDSEIKRRQTLFNEARDALGESTIDIYKYQRFFKEGRLKEAIPHLFIICDEFAELKAQQPEFMDNLISVARIGRSLGVHLILATQKPSGVVNDQIWSNTKFRVCLRVQDEMDSKEMLKRPEAASIKQTGRFYLQVGYDEYFALGQSAWCGAKYYPRDKMMKQTDKSINFINETGQVIKSIQAASSIKIAPEGEQITAIMKYIINIAHQMNKKARRLWLENIPNIILEEDIQEKYQITTTPFSVKAIIGEYDAPEKQEQGVVLYDLLQDGNTIIYGNDGMEREMLLNAIIYSSCKHHTVEEINYYIIDYGSETLRKYKPLLHVGGIVFAGEEEKFHNLIKLIKEDIKKRKKLFADCGGNYQNYIKTSGEKRPLKVVVVNNYDSLYENYPEIYDTFPDLVRDSERLGIIFIFTATAINSVASKITQSCQNTYAFKLKDSAEYMALFGMRRKVIPRDILGRGILNKDGLHEFQVCSIKKEEEETSTYLQEFIIEQNKKNKKTARKIPTLPEFVRLKDIEEELESIKQVPIGISKKELEILTVDYLLNTGNIIASNKLINTKNFVESLLYVFRLLPSTNILVIDPLGGLELNKMQYPNYYTENITEVVEQIIDYVQKLTEVKSEGKGLLLIYGLNKFVDKLEDANKLTELFKTLKNYEKFTCIVVDDGAKMKNYAYEPWFTNTFTLSDGIWIGRGIVEQSVFRLATITKEMTVDYKNDMGYLISENVATLCKFIDFFSKEEAEDEK